MQSQLGTLDIMTFLLGISLIAYDINNEEISRMGKFGTYMAVTFIALFLLFLFFSILSYMTTCTCLTSISYCYPL